MIITIKQIIRSINYDFAQFFFLNQIKSSLNNRLISQSTNSLVEKAVKLFKNLTTIAKLTPNQN